LFPGFGAFKRLLGPFVCRHGRNVREICVQVNDI